MYYALITFKNVPKLGFAHHFYAESYDHTRQKIENNLEIVYIKKGNLTISLGEKTMLAKPGRVKLIAITPNSLYSILDPIEGERTKNAAYKMLNAMFNRAIKWGYIDTNPCVRIDMPQYRAPEKQPLSKEQIKIVMQNIGEEELKYQALFYFAVLCGLRRQEILGFKWEDIDFEQDCFYVRRAATEKKGVGTVTKGTKTKRSERVLFLPALLKEILLKYKCEQDRQNILWEISGMMRTVCLLNMTASLCICRRHHIGGVNFLRKMA